MYLAIVHYLTCTTIPGRQK